MNNINILSITFARPYLLFLIIPLILIAFIPYLRLKPKRRHTRNKVTSLILHSLIIVLACVVLSGIEGHRIENVDSEIVFVTDYSESTKDVHQQMNDFVDKFVTNPRNSGSKIGLVYFGYDKCEVAELSKTNDIKNKQIEFKDSKVDKSATDIENALIKAVSLFDSENKNTKLVRRIILLTDAIDTDGEISSCASTLNQNNIRLDAIFFEPKNYNAMTEAQIQNVEIPSSTVPFKETSIKVVMKSHALMRVKLNIEDNGKSIFTNDYYIDLDGSGLEQEFEIKHTFNEADVHEIKVNFEATNNNDIVKENNIYYTYCYLEAENSILIIAPEGENTTLFTQTIESYGYNPTVVTPLNAPDFNGLAAYKEVILMDMNVNSLPASFSKDLYNYVYKAGGSLLTTGGKTAYTLGNMKGTLYEDMLPISLTPQANNPRAIVLCLDYSNSMGMKTFAGSEIYSKTNSGLQEPHLDETNASRYTRINIALKGIIESIRSSLNPYDYLGLITFGPIKPKKGIDETNVIFGLTPATNKEVMIEKVRSVRKPSTEGGTDYDNALEYAEDMLTTFTKKVNKKTVVLINDYDGGNDDASKYLETVKRMLANGIDMSTITIGTQKPEQILNIQKLIGTSNSYLCQSEGQFATVIKELCKSLATKAQNTLKNNAKFEVEFGSKIGKDVVEENLPLINCYNGGVSTKSGAMTHVYFHNQEEVEDPDNPGKPIKLNNKDPIYSEWDYGNGKVGSLMIDLSGEWCPDFFTNEDSLKMLKNIFNGLVPTKDPDTMIIEIDGHLISDEEELIVFNANYSRSLQITLLNLNDDEDETAQKVKLDVSISEYDVNSKKKTNTNQFTIESKSGEKYEKDFITKKAGLYIIEVDEIVNDKKVASKTTYATFSYSEEYDTFYSTEDKLHALSDLCSSTFTESNGEKTVGKVYYGTTGIDENADKMTSSLNVTINIQLPLMIIALFLFMLDIAVRKFNFLWPHEFIAKLKNKEKEN